MLNISMIALTLSTFCLMSGLASLGESVPASKFVVPAFVPAGQVAIVLISFFSRLIFSTQVQSSHNVSFLEVSIVFYRKIV